MNDYFQEIKRYLERAGLPNNISHELEESPNFHRFSVRRAQILSKLVRLFAKEHNPLELAKAAVELVSKATNADSVFIYLWDSKKEKLVLKVVTKSDVDSGFEEIEIPLGIGITGWSAQTRRSVLLKNSIHDDPRWISYESISESRFNSLMMVPIVDTEVLYGVFAVYSSKENHFDSADVALAEEVGSLLASGMERAEKTEILKAKSAAARFLLDFSATATNTTITALQEILLRVIDIVNVEACVIDFFSWFGANPNPVVFAQIDPEREIPNIWITNSRHLARQNIESFETNYLDHRNVSIGFGSSHGLLRCFRQKRFTPSEIELLSALAIQIGILLESIVSTSKGATAVSKLLTAKTDDEVVESLQAIGWPMKQFLPVLFEVQTLDGDVKSLILNMREVAAEQLKSNVMVIGSGAVFLMLIEASANKSFDHYFDSFRTWLTDIGTPINLHASVGIGEISNGKDNLLEVIRKSQTALRWASFTNSTEPLKFFSFKKQNSISQLPFLLNDMAPIIVEIRRELEIIERYDEEHGLQLLQTLKVYADQGGSIQRSSEILFVHRNTLRQRLDRIEQLLKKPLPLGTSWADLAIATKLSGDQA